MSTTLHNFAVWVIDGPDAGASERRMSCLAQHRANVVPLVQKGILTYGGALLSPESIASPTAEQKMVGSLMVYSAESLEAVRKIVESDIFYINGVWDKEKLVILPLVLPNLA